MHTHSLLKSITDEKGQPLYTDEALVDHLGQRSYQIVMTAIRETREGRRGSMGRHYRQALVYLNGLDWMIRNGKLDPKLREEATQGMGTFIKVLAEMHFLMNGGKENPPTS